MPIRTPTELSRADLLRVLARAPAVPAAPLARLLGWHRDEAAGPDPAPSPAPVTPALAAPTDAPVRYLARPAPVYWHLVGCEPLADAPGDDPAGATPGPAAAPDTVRLPPPDPRIAPLLNAGQWQNLWDRLPPSPRRGRAIDLRASLRRLTRAEPLRDLPRRPRCGFNRAVTLLLDRPAALRPVWDDLRLARRSLAALLGDELLAFQLPAGPDGPWLDLTPPPPRRERLAAATALPAGPDRIPPGALVVLIGAFGALETGEVSADWQRLLARLRTADHALLLVPVCPLRQTALPVAPLDPTGERADRAGADAARDTLLAALSQTWLPTPARLRQLRRAIPTADLHTELRAYNAPDCARDALHLWLDPDRLPVWLHRFAGLPAAQRAALRPAIEHWRRGLDAGALACERLQGNLLHPGPPDGYSGLAAQAAAVAAALDGPNTMARAQLASMLPVLGQLDPAVHPCWRPVLRDVQRLAGLIGRGPVADLAAGPAERHALYQRGADLVVRPGGDGLLPIGPRAYSLETGRLVDGAPLTGRRALTIIDRAHRWRLATTTRPRWAERLWCDGQDLFAAHTDNALLRWQPAAPGRPAGAWQPVHNPWPWAAEIGADDHGLWARLQVQGIGYRLRWCPTGRFWMGSPDDEPERRNDETLHEVELTQGFWLGETAVTQALWRAVTGQDPSQFKGDDLPVETVSWDDCQGFIAKLARLAPGLGPALPTEAQWEYACRAGTRTAFSFSDALDTGQANYNGRFPYNNGSNGEGRERTLPVASFAPNPWGLYQMHGNVWEWCADRFGDYPVGAVADPAGPAERLGVRGRVLRGGSWSNEGQYLRSAYRRHYSPTYRAHDFGLRLAGGVDRQAGPAGVGAMTADAPMRVIGRGSLPSPLGHVSGVIRVGG